MAFLDNSGDIILDAVLTDTGRLRLAQGDGSFKISKFALGDDEINYALYNKNHASGSAYFDLEILQTPVLEAITNNSSQIKSRLMTISRTNLLFLPTFKLNTNDAPSFTAQHGDSRLFSRNVPAGSLSTTAKADAKFYIAVDQFTQEAIRHYREETTESGRGAAANSSQVAGVLQGFTTGANSNLNPSIIRVDQGLDTQEISPAIQLDADMLETAFLVELDYRLGRVKEPTAAEGLAAFNFVDDDNVASYYLTQEGLYVNPKINYAPKNNNLSADDTSTADPNDPQVFSGPRGNTLHMRIQASQELQSSTYLFTQIGRNDAVGSDVLGLASNDPYVTGKRVYYIDSTVRVIGANTGFRLDIPVRYVKIK